MTVRATMRAPVLTRHGDLNALTVRAEWPVPRPGVGEALVAAKRYVGKLVLQVTPA